MDISTLQQTDLHLARLSGGTVDDHGDHVIVRTPSNPGYYHGNYLLLAGPPRPDDLPRWRARAAETFEHGHVCLRWDGPAPDDALLAAAVAAGFERDDGVAMALAEVRHDRPAAVRIRPHADTARITALNVACDIAERTGSADYRTFKERLRASWWRWIEQGAATWWGAFDGDRLVGQCGLVPIGELGRLQAVEVHPDHRGRGVGSTLVAAVARGALDAGVRRVVLAAEPDGPAVGMYERLGFTPVGHQRSLLATEEALQIRGEDPADEAAVRALLISAFGRAAEAELVAGLRAAPDVITRVAVRRGQVLGHALFSPVRVSTASTDWPAVALGPVAVRPDHQRQGVGDALIRAGLQACREAGQGACFVLGGPDYYGRFGFQAAGARGLRCIWPVPEPVFQVLELRPGGISPGAGTVHYHPLFDAT